MKPACFSFALVAILAIPVVARAADDPFAAVNAKMHHAMMVKPSGDTDTDFVRGMIPHHQGAVDMAKIELEQGKDPELRSLAQSIITSQKREIDMMNAWLLKHAPEYSETPDAIKHHH